MPQGSRRREFESPQWMECMNLTQWSLQATPRALPSASPLSHSVSSLSVSSHNLFSLITPSVPRLPPLLAPSAPACLKYLCDTFSAAVPPPLVAPSLHMPALSAASMYVCMSLHMPALSAASLHVRSRLSACETWLYYRT